MNLKSTSSLFIRTFFIFLLNLSLFAQSDHEANFFKYYLQNEYDSALIFLEKNNNQFIAPGEAKFYAGKIYFALAQYEKTISILKPAITNTPFDLHIYYLLGQAYENQEQDSLAIEAYHNALKWKSDYSPTRLRLAALYSSLGNNSEAIKVIHELISYDSTHVPGLLQLARNYNRINQPDSALLFLNQAAYYDSTNFEVRFEIGAVLVKKEDFSTALKSFLKLQMQNSLHDGVYYYLGECYAKLKQIEKAIDSYQKGEKIKGRYFKKCLKRLVKYYFDTQAYEKCIAAAKNLFNGDETEPEAFFYEGAALSALKQFDLADSTFSLALKAANLDFIKLIFHFQGLNAYYDKEYAKAMDLYRKIISIDPLYKDAYYNMALVYDKYYRDKRFALDWYNRFLSLADSTEDQVMIEMAEKRIEIIKEAEFFKRK